ncbi:DnaJ chaperone protein [Trypanosoma grayi]|uniref:DnaJ chaperone protein n=1 Tax=Trypanosoma grayi TaxID=71804 RepID=UPI0004F427F5|nr:DnaJ chaperone protein [Trypanosoma grayi]KEG08615.1 DnaJ chaperone protein [Trypanosoma grayi]
MQSAPAHVQKDTILHLTYYEIFSCDPAAQSIDLDSVQRAYRRFALLFHPDKDPSPAAREAFERVKLAAETLTDPLKRREYDEDLQQAQRRLHSDTTTAVQQQKREEMEEEARVADMILRQKEAETAAKAAATRKEEAEKEAAARQMLHELTESLTTPFKQMEAVLVHEWDIDEELLQMKKKEVESLLQMLREYEDSRGVYRGADAVHASGAKRRRNDEAEGEV